MPAPLAKGIIVSISLLVAAGLAVYENPQVKQWVDENRRKIAFALHNLGDDFDPYSHSRRNSSQDASTREYDTAEAVERRRQARQEILERGRRMEERRRSKQAGSAKSRSFDDLVDGEGNLKTDATQATSSAAEPKAGQSGLRNRNHEASGVALGTEAANPFADEACLGDLSENTIPVQTSTHRSRSSSTATLPANPLPPAVPPKEPIEPIASPPVPPKTPLDSSPSPFAPAIQQQPRLLIDTDDLSNHPSEALVDYTPTTSAPSSAADDLSELDQQAHPSSHQSDSNFWSVHEWAESNTAPAQFYSPPRSEAAPAGNTNANRIEEGANREEGQDSETESIEQISRFGSESDMDVMSEMSGMDTPPGSWSEVASQVSEDF
ncbi:MAG: hypothetical protein Q9183_003288 [Haloplaca sp. 2 TL-2023]